MIEEFLEEFLNDIEQKKPLIVDTSSTNENIPPLEKSERSSWNNTPKAGYTGNPCPLNPEMEKVFTAINSKYEHVGTMEQQNWKIYEYKE